MSSQGYILLQESNSLKDSKDVIFNMRKRWIILISILGLLFSERGDLISYEYVDSRDVDTIQNQLNEQFGSSLAPDALYDIHLYSVTYETIDQFGEVTIASGIISFPDDINGAYPILTFQHGTQIRRTKSLLKGMVVVVCAVLRFWLFWYLS